MQLPPIPDPRGIPLGVYGLRAAMIDWYRSIPDGDHASLRLAMDRPPAGRSLAERLYAAAWVLATSPGAPDRARPPASAPGRPPYPHMDLLGPDRDARRILLALWTEDYLAKILPPGSTVYTVLRTVSRSGLSRTVSTLAIVRDSSNPPALVNISGYVGDALGYPWRDGALMVGGCGFDAGHHIVHCLSLALHGRDSARIPPSVPGLSDHRAELSRNPGDTLRKEWI